MTSAKIVMLAVDGSSQAENAFKYYIANFHNDTNYLLVVHAAEPGVHSWQKSTSNTQELWDHLLENEAQNVKDLEEKYKNMMEHLKVNGRVMTLMSNKPGESLCRIAKSEECAMIVIGARGQGRMRRTILGSVSNYVVHHAHCPVVVCRQTGSGFCNVCGPK